MLARPDALRALASESFDVLVVGGGITGAGVAFDAATRGYSVALVERADFASGTSSRSSKLVHGGLRYLQNLDLGLVREAVLERQLLTALAPHLVKPLPFVVPAFDGARPDRLMGLGLNMYDAMAVERGRRSPLGRRRIKDVDLDGHEDWSPERHRIIGGAELAERIPALAGRSPSSGYLFYDCQTDDARMVLTVLSEAERFGAVAANRVEAEHLASDGAGRATGVHAVDRETGERFVIRAATVVNATGVWADRLGPEAQQPDGAQAPVIRPSRGTHLVLPRDTLPLDDAVIVPAAGGRTIFVVPWLGHSLIGTTDNDYEGTLDHIRPSGEDVAYLLDACNAFFERDLTAEDASGAYAGVRPLISASDPKRSVDISRRAELYETASGMITITGGKLTTWRRMAKMTVDRIVEREGRSAPCRTHEIPLGMAVDPDDLPRVDGVPDDAYARLAARYGYAAHEVLGVAAERPELARPILDGTPDLLAEAAYAARREQARSAGDVLLRRTRLALLAARRLRDEAEAVDRVAAAVGAELGWTAAETARQTAAFRDEAVAEGLVVG